MRIRALLSTIISLLFVCFVVSSTVSCGPPKPQGKTASVKAGSMPADAEWTGVYYSPLFGHLHVVHDGNLVEGRWQRPRKGQWGKLQGNADGNLLKFDWEEFVDGLVGPNSKKVGKGYFLYTRPTGENVDDEIVGQIGRGDDEVGTEWKAIKQRNTEPDINSIGGSGAADVGGGDWDSDNTEGGEPDEPTEPEVEAPEL